MNDNFPDLGWHRLLRRQYKKSIEDGELSSEGLGKLFGLISNSYFYFDEERRLNQRAEDISNGELKDINSELETKNAFLDSFNYGLAHDAKNHTANLKGLLKMFAKYNGKSDPTMVDTIIRKLELSVNQMSSILDGFLFLSSSASMSSSERVPINKKDLVENVSLEIAYLMEEKEHTIEWDFDIEGLCFSYHTIRIILVNLISNSLKYATKGLRAEIKVRAWLDPLWLNIEVQDNGIGMNLEDKNSTMYKLFDRRSEASSVKGFGIGLFMIKKILDWNKGEINIESELRKGTTVGIRLPM